MMSACGYNTCIIRLCLKLARVENIEKCPARTQMYLNLDRPLSENKSKRETRAGLAEEKRGTKVVLENSISPFRPMRLAQMWAIVCTRRLS